jgi:type II secretory pathway component GspD/PulD (secretin)
MNNESEPVMRRMRVCALPLILITALVGTPGSIAAQIPPRPGQQQRPLDINFQEVDLSYAFTMLAQMAGLNVIHSNLPNQTLTMRTVTPVNVQDIPALIRTLAASYGIAVSEVGGFLRLQGQLGPMQEMPPDTRQLFIYRLKHARAPVLSQTLLALFGFGGSSTTTTTSAQTLSQRLQQMQQQQFNIQQQQAVRPPQVVVSGNPFSLQNAVQIVPDEVTNSLVIRATPNDYAIIMQAVQSLDLRPMQVLIEVVIAEVSRTNDLNVGVEVTANDTEAGAGRTTRGTLRDDTPDNFSLRIVRTGRINVDATLSALAATGNVRILSRPVIQAQNNQEATIQVGEQRPFVQISRSLPTDQQIRDEVVQYRDVATTLTITPTINPDGYVNLVILQEVNNASNEVQFGAPVITTRSASTQLLARDGQTIVIGGLIDHQRERNRSGIPFLKDIPIIGALFGSTRNSDRNTELFLFLTPHVVATDADADRIKQELERNAELLGPIRPIRPIVRPLLRPDTIRNDR